MNGEQPFWLAGLTEMTRTFGLELIESILTSFPAIFYKVRLDGWVGGGMGAWMLVRGCEP